MIVHQFRTKPVDVEAVQWDGTPGAAYGIIDWVNSNSGQRARLLPDVVRMSHWDEGLPVRISLSESHLRLVYPHDWVVRHPMLGFIKCEPEDLARIYEVA